MIYYFELFESLTESTDCGNLTYPGHIHEDKVDNGFGDFDAIQLNNLENKGCNIQMSEGQIN